MVPHFHGPCITIQPWTDQPSGPQFLLLFAIALVMAMAVAGAIRQYLSRGSPDQAPQPIELDPYEVAYLAGGRRAAVHGALASLMQQGILQVGREAKVTRAGADAFVESLHLLERTVGLGTI